MKCVSITEDEKKMCNKPHAGGFYYSLKEILEKKSC